MKAMVRSGAESLFYRSRDNRPAAPRRADCCPEVRLIERVARFKLLWVSSVETGQRALRREGFLPAHGSEASSVLRSGSVSIW